MNHAHAYSKIVTVSKTGGIRIPKFFRELLGSKVILEQLDGGLLVKPATQIAPLSEWDRLFFAADTMVETEFNDWDVTQQDGIA